MDGAPIRSVREDGADGMAKARIDAGQIARGKVQTARAKTAAQRVVIGRNTANRGAA